MNPMVHNHMGYIHQQEILEQVEKNRNRKPVRVHVANFGNVLIRIGQKLVNATDSAS